MVTFTVYGEAAPQGSKAPWGAESNPRTRPWRAAVTAEAAETMKDRRVITGPVELTVVFHFLRPKGHYGTGKNEGVVKGSAPSHHTKTPDLDKLIRAIGDALKGVVLRDDSQICAVRARKTYGETAKAVVTLTELA